MKTAHEEWLGYAAAIGIGHMNPRDAQYVETRRAFYAGTLNGICALRNAADATPDTPDGEARSVEQIEAFYQEVVAFNERVKKGLA